MPPRTMRAACLLVALSTLLQQTGTAERTGPFQRAGTVQRTGPRPSERLRPLERDRGPVPSSALDDEEPICCRDSLPGAINDFSFKLWDHLVPGRDGNIFISPLSIGVALAMTYAGADGQTAQEMQQVLGYEKHDLDTSEVKEGFRKLLNTLSRGNEAYSLLVANAMFLQKTFEVMPEYIQDIQSNFQGAVEYVDFARSGQNAVEVINNWVAQKTQNLIQKLFEAPLSPMTRMMLLNAIYFKGTWKVQFPKNKSYDSTFYKGGGKTKPVTMMVLHNEKFRFLEDRDMGYKFLELPYKGNDIAMLLALPIKTESPADLKMTSEDLCHLNTTMKMLEISDVILPRFKMEYTSELKEPLMKMGMRSVFTPGSADLSKIRQMNIKVDSVLHKAVIQVNEEGSEAAAVTGVVLVTYSLKSIPTFVANHPFLLYIIDKRNGLVLFSGRVVDP